MVNPHTSVAIAELVFYLPTLPVAVFILVKNWNNRPRLAWYPLVTFSLLRIAGAIVTITRDSRPESIGLMIAATILLNIGLIPLLISLIGVLRVILKSSKDDNTRAHRFLKVIRFLFLAALILICVGGGLSGDGPGVLQARVPAQAGYTLLLIVLILATIMLLHLWSEKGRIASSKVVFIELGLLTVPFLAIRAAYGLLYEFTIQDFSSKWNPLAGSAVAFALMGLLTEYIALLLFLYLGFRQFKYHQYKGRRLETVGSPSELY